MIPNCEKCGHPWSRHLESKGSSAADTGKGLKGELHQQEVCLECLYGPRAPPQEPAYKR